MRATIRIQCSSGAVEALAAHGARSAAFVIVGDSTWITEFAPNSDLESHELYDGRLLGVALVASHDGGYRLLGSDSRSPRILSIYTPSPSSRDAATPPEWIEMPDTRAIADLVEAPDGRSRALLFNGTSPGPLRLLTRSIEGTWSDRMVTDRRISPAALALDASGRTAITFVESSDRAPYSALRTQIDEQPAMTITPWIDGSLLAAVIPSGASMPVLAYTTRDATRVAVVDERGRARTAASLPTHAAAGGCTHPVLDANAANPPSQCRINTQSSDDPVLAASGNGAVWVLNVEHHIDIDQSVTMHCLPVDPPGHTGRRWVRPNTCQFAFHPIADRSFAELVVRWLDPHARSPVVAERARIRLALPPTAHRLITSVTETGGVLHVLVTEPSQARAAGVYLAIDESALTP